MLYIHIDLSVSLSLSLYIYIYVCVCVVVYLLVELGRLCEVGVSAEIAQPYIHASIRLP